jgi:hypothetical protein
VDKSSFTLSRSARRLLTLITAAALGIDAYVHWHLAARYDTLIGSASPHISQGGLFRVEAALALVAMVLVLATRRRLAAAFAFLIAAGGLGATAVWLCRRRWLRSVARHVRPHLVHPEDPQRCRRSGRRRGRALPALVATTVVKWTRFPDGAASLRRDNSLEGDTSMNGASRVSPGGAGAFGCPSGCSRPEGTPADRTTRWLGLVENEPRGGTFS